MQLGTGTRIGPYEITGLLGAGGMGEVYRARDSKLGRSVAVKVLAPALANDADYISRFEREAQVLASLNHPNIAQIYGLEAGAIVMELVEGPTLADRIAKGPVPVEEAIQIALQIAEALEAAHERGIVHRDLKPANVKLTAEGTVKVLDFGLAKVGEVMATATTANSPTLTLRTGAVGTILGTAGYMAPEQAAGKPVDRRADIWAFGVVLWEMVTGRRLFDGETVSHTLADVLRAPIDVSAAPASMRPLIGRCLDRDLKTRLQWIGEARIALPKAFDVPVAFTEKRTDWRWPAVAALAVLVAAVSAWGWYSGRTETPDRPLLRFNETLGSGLVIRDARDGPTPYVGPAVVVSRDGRRLVFVASQEGKPPQLYTRRLDEAIAKPIDGTEGAATPFLSPDGRWVGYTSGGKLYKVRLDGGSAIPICEVGQPFGAWWADDGTIVFNMHIGSGLFRVSERGGVPQPVTKTVQEKENTHRWPQVLPGAKAVLFSAGMGGRFGEATVEVQRLDTGERTTLATQATFGRYLPSGYLTYVSRGALFAVEFDVDTLQTRGEALPILQDVRYSPGAGGAQFDFSSNGVAVYRQSSASSGARLVRMASDGKVTPLPGLDGHYESPVLSPDGRHIAIIKLEGGNSQLWVIDLQGGRRTRLTFDDSGHGSPHWTPDGHRLVFSAHTGIYSTRADGAGRPVRLMEERGRLTGVTPDGKTLLFTSLGACWAVQIEGDPDRPFVGPRKRCLQGDERPPFVELSPDGRWLAYSVAGQGNRAEIFVRSFPDRGGRWQVSASGGTRPQWARNSPELFFISENDELISVPYRVSGGSFSAGAPRKWLSNLMLTGNYSPAPDGKSVIMAIADEPSHGADASVSVLLNFFDEVRRQAGGERE